MKTHTHIYRHTHTHVFLYAYKIIAFNKAFSNILGVSDPFPHPSSAISSPGQVNFLKVKTINYIREV